MLLLAFSMSVWIKTRVYVRAAPQRPHLCCCWGCDDVIKADERLVYLRPHEEKLQCFVLERPGDTKTQRDKETKEAQTVSFSSNKTKQAKQREFSQLGHSDAFTASLVIRPLNTHLIKHSSHQLSSQTMSSDSVSDDTALKIKSRSFKHGQKKSTTTLKMHFSNKHPITDLHIMLLILHQIIKYIYWTSCYSHGLLQPWSCDLWPLPSAVMSLITQNFGWPSRCHCVDVSGVPAADWSTDSRWA